MGFQVIPDKLVLPAARKAHHYILASGCGAVG